MTPSFRIRAAALASLVAAAACNTDRVSSLNGPVLSSFQPITSRGQVQQLASGVLDADRQNYTGAVVGLSIVGRDLYRIDPSEPRWVTVIDRGLGAGSSWAIDSSCGLAISLGIVHSRLQLLASKPPPPVAPSATAVRRSSSSPAS